MSVEQFKKNIEYFEISVKKLSSDINQASSLWKDPKFSELSSSVGEIANQSRDIIVAADKSCASIDKFNKIAAEKY